MSSARTEEADTIANSEKVASVLILGLNGEAWDRALIWSLIAAAIAAVLVGLTTAGSIITHKREAEAAEASLERYKETVTGRVADAKTEGIRAGETAGNALERAGRLEVEAAEARERAAAMEARVAELNLEIERLRLPRKLNVDQGGIIYDACLKFKGMKYDLGTTPGDKEALDLAEQIEIILNGVGWDQLDWQGKGTYLQRDGKRALGLSVTSGIEIFYDKADAENYHNAANALSGALTETGIKNTVFAAEWKSAPEGGMGPLKDRLHVYVGQKSQ